MDDAEKTEVFNAFSSSVFMNKVSYQMINDREEDK